jgi:hypothetical protein
MAYYDKAGVKVMSYEGTADVMSYYPETVKDWGRTSESRRCTQYIGISTSSRRRILAW